VEAIGRIGFDNLTTAHREKRLEDVAAAAHGELGRLDWDDEAWAVIEAVAGSTGVIITGGGNLSVLRPEHVYECVALARIAAAVARPLALSGQMLGPFLDQRAEALVSELLASAKAVGVRDSLSLEIADRLIGGGRASLLADDALFLGDPAGDGEDGPIVATFAPFLAGIPVEAFVEGAALTLETIRQLTGSEVRFVPHVGTQGQDDDGDSHMHARIAEQLGHGSLEPLLDPAAAATLHRSACFTLSSRYHPIVFASMGGRPMIGSPTDDYNGTKIRGALGLVGLQQGLVPAGALGGTLATATATALWRARGEIRQSCDSRRPSIEAALRQWWDALAQSFGGGAIDAVHAAVEIDILGSAMAVESRRTSLVMLSAGSENLLNENRSLSQQSELSAMTRALEHSQREVSECREELSRTTTNAIELEDALKASHHLLSQVMSPLVQSSLSRNVDRYIPPSTVEGLLETRTFRWARSARRAMATVNRWVGKTRRSRRQ
jgi:hypothetical protein